MVGPHQGLSRVTAMSKEYIDADHLRPLFASGRFCCTEGNACAEFQRYLLKFAVWRGAKIDWSRMQPAARLNLSSLSKQEMLSRLRLTAMGQKDLIMVCYSAKQHGLVGSLDGVVDQFDLLFSRAPGP